MCSYTIDVNRDTHKHFYATNDEYGPNDSGKFLDRQYKETTLCSVVSI